MNLMQAMYTKNQITTGFWKQYNLLLFWWKTSNDGAYVPTKYWNC
jgi:hypothetical protein